jgi:hypothetical protein
MSRPIAVKMTWMQHVIGRFDWNFLFCVIAQLVDWLPLAAMGQSVFAPIHNDQ